MRVRVEQLRDQRERALRRRGHQQRAAVGRARLEQRRAEGTVLRASAPSAAAAAATAVNKRGEGALHCAALGGHLDVISLLLSRTPLRLTGERALDGAGRSPLDLCSAMDRTLLQQLHLLLIVLLEAAALIRSSKHLLTDALCCPYAHTRWKHASCLPPGRPALLTMTFSHSSAGCARA